MGEVGEQASRPRGRRRAGETRGLLIDACTELVRAEGAGALSVQRVAKAAGISPPGFYKHFSNTDALLSVAVVDVVAALADRQSLTAIDPLAGTRTELPSHEEGIAALDAMLSILLTEPQFAELYLRYQHDPTMLDGAFTRIARKSREDNVAYYWGLARRMGARPRDYARVVIIAEQALALYYHAAELLLSGEHDRELVIETTVRALDAISRELWPKDGFIERTS